VHVCARAQEADVSVAIFFRALLEPVDDFRFRHLARDIEVSSEAILSWNWRKKVIDRAHANGFEHGLAISRRLWKISHKEIADLRLPRGACAIRIIDFRLLSIDSAEQERHFKRVSIVTGQSATVNFLLSTLFVHKFFVVSSGEERV